LSADIVDAKTALDWGLVDWVVDANAFESCISELTERVRSMAWTSTRLTKKLTNMAFDTPLEPFIQTYLDFQQVCMTSPEHQQAMAEHRSAHKTR
jgi:enoyl-CoA hydratase/carnithine racemase